MKKILPGLLGLWLFCLVSLFFPFPAYAQDIDCIGSSLANYIADVFAGLGISPGSSSNSFGQIQFLSPAFNMTNAGFPALVEKLNSGLNSRGYSLNNFYAIAGNAYNTSWGLISDFINTARGTAIGGKSIILTEIGWYPHETNDRGTAVGQLRNEIAKFGSKNVIGGLIFDVFGNNPQFAAQSMTNDEINIACSGNCFSARVGANSAVYYSSSDGSFYDKAGANRMKYTLEIANNDTNRSFPSLMPGINSALSKGMTPILRLGVGYSSGGFDNPSDLVSFIQDLNNNLTGDVYVIIGPNEPLSECWATPGCKCGSLIKSGPVTISDSSHVCSDFIETRTSSSKSTSYGSRPTPVLGTAASGPRVLAAAGQFIPATIIGNITLEAIKFPHFGFFTRSLVNQLDSLLPLVYQGDYQLPGDSTLYFRHFVQGQDVNGNFDPSTTTPCDEAPQSEVTLPAAIWGNLAGAIRGLCGMIGHGVCAPLYNYNISLAQPGYSCLIGSCAPGQEAHPYPLSVSQNTNSDFSVNGYIKRKTEVVSEEIINNTQVTTTKTTDTKKIKVLSRSALPGGSETASNVSFLRLYIPEEIVNLVLPGDEARALAEGFRYGVAFSPVDPGEHPGQYYQLRTMRNLWCMRLAELYPGEFPISSIDPLCPSRDPNHPAYQDPPLFYPEPDNLPEFCQWDPWIGGCDYHDPDYCANYQPNNPDCDVNKLCEGGKCLPYSLPAPGFFICDDPNNPTCGFNQCLGKCHWENFQKNPQGGYGLCQYKNTNVCIRNDSTGGCAGVCNAACCPGG